MLASQVALVVKNVPSNAGNVRDAGLIPESGRSLEVGHGNPLQYSCLENPHGQGSLVGYSPQGCKESDKTEQLSTAQLCISIWLYKFVLRTFTHLCCLIFVCFRSQSIDQTLYKHTYKQRERETEFSNEEIAASWRKKLRR